MHPNQKSNLEENKDSNSKIEFPNISTNTENNHGKKSKGFKRFFKFMHGESEKKETKNYSAQNLEDVLFELNKPKDDFPSEDTNLDINILQNVKSNNGCPWLKAINCISEQNNDCSLKKLRKKIFKTIKLNKKRQREEIQYNDTENFENLIDFLNNGLLKEKNDILRKSGCQLHFIEFPKNFVSNLIAKKGSKNLFQLTLEEIFRKKELYTQEDIKTLFEPNLEVLKKLRSDEKYKNIMMQSGLEKKLPMKICELYQEFLDSNKFKNGPDNY
jgi:hypothetical protein